MPHLEIERKFLVDKEKWASLQKPAGDHYLQGYLSIDREKVVRVRTAGDRGFITIKGASETFSHPEYEYEIPLADATELILSYTRNTINKTRYRIPAGNHIWEVDVFEGDNEGLIIAEIELTALDEFFEIPSWVGDEVTSDKRYYNANLSMHPFSVWTK
jgi:CYTH domain-containing protein